MALIATVLAHFAAPVADPLATHHLADNVHVLPGTRAHALLAFYAEYDSACTYAIRRPRLARQCLRAARALAVQMRRPDLAYRCNELMEVL